MSVNLLNDTHSNQTTVILPNDFHIFVILTNFVVPIIKKYVKPGGKINSDMWKAYYCLGREGYQHAMVNHDFYFVDPRTKAHTDKYLTHKI